jgi:DNA-binding SARP family transcriptional activator
MTATLRCRLFGPSLNGRFTVAEGEADPRTVVISARKGQAVLSYLAMQPEYSATRGQLATLLWGDRTDELARQNLRQCLATLRRELATAAPDVFIVERDAVRLRERCVIVDAVEFAALGDAYELPRLERAVALYHGEFLAGTGVEADTFVDWVAGERGRLQAVAARILERYVEKTNALGDGQKAIDAGQWLVALDPLREDWQRSLLRLYARYQGRDAAIAHARALTALLRKELDVDPAPATAALVADIERGATAPGWSAARSPAGDPQRGVPLASLLVAKPTIVVFPFDDLSPNRDQDHFARGLVAEILAALSCMKSLSVVASNSDRATQVDQLTRELGADYALKGCVRVAGIRVRIATQLVDACSGDHIWTGRSDHAVRDVFAMQEEVAAKIAASVEPHVYAAEGIRASRRPLHALDARGCVMRAISLINIRSRRNYALAEELLKRAIEIDPTCAHAYSLFAYVMALEVVYGWKPRENTMATARDVAHNAVLLDVDAPWSHFALGYVHAQSRRTDEAIAAYEKALALNPNFGVAHTYLGSALSVLGRSEAALAQIDVAERLSSREIFYGVNNYVRANAHFAAGRYREAGVSARNSVRQSPGIVTSHRHVVVNFALSGAIGEAKTALDDLLRLVPGTSLRAIDEALPYVREQDRSRFLDAFHSVGIE